ncbi:metal ABC transporter ATP-binding protein [Solidesulfovibrio sp. C21]|uniref:metal ABC transporter ATP-binding protein n=1 Tax=Solidesulfovibrio sp. C21 TaxID=3398613 RepID=UPI0039FBA24E
MSEAVVDIRDLTFAYNGQAALSGVSLAVATGDRLAVLGPNGGGKTTLLKLILGILQPTSGTIRVFGREPGRQSARIGYVPQRLEGVAERKDLPIRVREVALMGLLASGRYGFRFSRDEMRRADAALTRVEMLPLADKRFCELSGGQKQRTLIARALVSDPDLLILDEPTANIDPQGKFCLYEVLSRIGQGVTSLVVSHDLSILAAGVTAVACVNARVLYAPQPKLTQEMVDLLYGVHSHTCPLDAYLRRITPELAGFTSLETR